MTPLRSHIRAFWASDQRGGASVEFVILFPIFVTIFLSTFEGAMLLIRQSILERSLDLAVRELRLGTGTVMTHAMVKDAVCDHADMLPDCSDNLLLELNIVNQGDYALPTGQAVCVDRINSVTPVTTFNQGTLNDLMVVRACYVVNPMFPGSQLGLTLTKDTQGELYMTAASAFVNEPI